MTTCCLFEQLGSEAFNSGVMLREGSSLIPTDMFKKNFVMMSPSPALRLYAPLLAIFTHYPGGEKKTKTNFPYFFSKFS